MWTRIQVLVFILMRIRIWIQLLHSDRDLNPTSKMMWIHADLDSVRNTDAILKGLVA
jgi:hypothetical protein